MRIAVVAWRDLAHPQAGGSEVLVDQLARGCEQRGHEVTLLCGSPTQERSYTVHPLGGTYAQYARAPLVHARHARSADVLVDVENGIPFFSPLWRRKPVVCLVHHVHGPQWRQHFSRPVAAVGWGLERRAMPAVYRGTPFIAVSPSTGSALEGLGIAPERIHIVPNGVEIPAQPATARSAEPLFLALGRLVPHKRVDLLLRVWERVRPRTGGRLVIAGDGPEAPRLKAMAGPGVEFRGAVGESEKQALLASAWALLHPAMHEGWGVVVLEAGAVRTPALGFDVPGVRDAIRDGVSGELAVSEADFGERWISLAGDAHARAKLGDGAHRHAARYSWPRTVDRFLGVLEEALAGQAGAGPRSAVPA